ncbi:unnamed protein product [Allacma fusca]|uniref:Protein farnesyltransferase subunit beta n=1 Tax=Allacma fusca TaxID=39272 RepID=A0A8J2J4L4_9HEXA|nr:unnamed protein product [Allacma fusca]
MSYKRRPISEVEKARTNHDGCITQTFDEQEEVEEHILNIYSAVSEQSGKSPENLIHVNREKHAIFLRKGLSGLSDAYESLDASRPWLCYWILHSLNLLNVKLAREETHAISDFLARCQSITEGGFGGGPGQFAHLAATYAAINAIVCLNSVDALKIINREKLLEFIKSMKLKDGSFRMHRGGEVDVRAAYCAIVAAKLTNIYSPELFEGTAEWVVTCQTYEGGFSGYPGMEAHGGYSFCALATLLLLKREQLMNSKSLVRWLAFRQMSLEGGFQGRTNKLVDGCYSFWQGACFSLLTKRLLLPLEREDDSEVLEKEWLYNPIALQEYILLCCQHSLGGLIDKPGKPRDFYHTCYTLSGLAASQHYAGASKIVLGPQRNLLEPIHSIFNLTTEVVQTAEAFFYGSSAEVEEIDSEEIIESISISS